VLTAQTILIVEDNAYLALDLCAAVEEMNGRVAGPACSVGEAMGILDSEPVSAAILDCQLPDGDVTPVARRLVRKGVPYVIQTGTAVPADLILLRSDAPVVMKPVDPKHVVAVLADHGRNRILRAWPAAAADAMTRNDAFLARENMRRFEAQLDGAEGTRKATIQLLLNDEQLHLRHLLAGSEQR
jgi:DNA-binding response OmpR family regulator